MDKCRFRNLSIKSTPLYTMDVITHDQPIESQCQQVVGPQIFMNTPSIGTSTQFQFHPGATNHTTTETSSKTILPIFSAVKAFFANLIKPTIQMDNKNTITYDKTMRRKYNSAPDIYTDITSDSKCDEDLENKSFVDLSSYEMLSKLSTSSKSFSNYDLPLTISNNFIPKTQEISTKIEQSTAMQTKDHKVDDSVTPDFIRLTSTTVPLKQNSKKNRKRNKTLNMATKQRSQCHDGLNAKRTTIGASACKKTTKIGKNKKQKQKHELAQTIREDVETEVIVSTLKEDQIVNPAFTTEKLGQISEPDSVDSDDSEDIVFAEFPTTSCYAFTSFTKERQRQISEGESEYSDDSFIVFDYEYSDDSFIVFDYDSPSPVESTSPTIFLHILNTLPDQRWQERQSSDHNYIYYELEGSHTDVDDAIIGESDDDDDNNDESDDESDEEENDENIVVNNDEIASRFDSENDIEIHEREKTWKVHFNLEPVVHHTSVFWFMSTRDQIRFAIRLQRLEPTLNSLLDLAHRKKIYNQRFHIKTDNV